MDMIPTTQCPKCNHKAERGTEHVCRTIRRDLFRSVNASVTDALGLLPPLFQDA